MWDQAAIDERPSVVRVSGAKPRDQSAEINLKEDQDQQAGSAGANGRWLIVMSLCENYTGAFGVPALPSPDQGDVDETGKDEMRG